MFLPQCVVVVWQLVERLKKLIADLPVYSTQFLVLMTRLLEEFHQCMEGLYRSEDLICVVMCESIHIYKG